MVLEAVIKYGKIVYEASKKFIIKYGKMAIDAIKTAGFLKIFKGTAEVVGAVVSIAPLFKRTSRALKYKAKNSMDVGLEIGSKKERTQYQNNLIKKVAKTAFKKDQMDSVEYKKELQKLDSRITKAQADKFESLCSEGLTKYDLNSKYAKFLRQNGLPENKVRELLLRNKTNIKERRMENDKENIVDRRFLGDDVFEDDYDGIEDEDNEILLRAANKYYKGEKLNRFEKFCFNEYLKNFGKKSLKEERRGMNTRAALAY